MRRESGPSNGADTEGGAEREYGVLSVCYCLTYAGRGFRRAGRLGSQSLQNASKNRPENRAQKGAGGRAISSPAASSASWWRGWDSNTGFLVSRCDARVCGVRDLPESIWGFPVVASGCGCFRVFVPWDGHNLVTDAARRDRGAQPGAARGARLAAFTRASAPRSVGWPAGPRPGLARPRSRLRQCPEGAGWRSGRRVRPGPRRPPGGSWDSGIRGPQGGS